MSKTTVSEKKAARAAARRRRIVLRALIIFAALTLAAAATVAVCMFAGSDRATLISLRYADGRYTDSRNGVSYLSAPVNYEPAALGEKYALCGDTVLYKIEDLPADKWLSEEYGGIGSVYYADTITLPSLADFRGTVLVCLSDNITVRLCEINDSGDIEKIHRALAEGETVSLPENGEYYHLKFTSPDYPGLYYDIVYAVSGNVRCFYDRTTKVCVDAGELMFGYIVPDAATADE